MQVTYTIEPHKTAASVLEDKEYSIGLWANCLKLGKLQDQEAFQAFSDLLSFGPANDWNGQRSNARRLYDEILTEILVPALSIYRASLEVR
jgi:hypothetical protein